MNYKKIGALTMALISASIYGAQTQQATKSPLPHASYKKGQLIIISEKEGAFSITNTPEGNASSIYVVEQYSVESYPNVGYSKRTVIASRLGDLCMFGYPLYRRTITLEEVCGEQPQGIKAPPGGLDAGAPAMDAVRPTRGGAILLAIFGSAFMTLFFKMSARIQELEAQQKKA